MDSSASFPLESSQQRPGAMTATSALSTLTFLCSCLCYCVTMNTTAIAFSENDVIYNVKMYINIVNPLSTGIHVDISAPLTSMFQRKQERIGPKEVITINVDKTAFQIKGTGKSDKGIIIHSNASEIIITVLSKALNSANMYFARNPTQLGTDYAILTFCNHSSICQFAILSQEDNTVTEIAFPGYFSSSIVLDGKHYGPGDVMTVTLHEAQIFQIQSKSDLSGIKIWSTNKKHFSVLSSNPITLVYNHKGRDHIADSVPPLEAWGKEYIVVRRHLTKFKQDYVKFLATARGANISVMGCGPVLLHRILGFQTFSYNMTCERIHIISDEAVLIAHFPVAKRNGDPAMYFPTPISHYVSEYTFYVPSGFSHCAVAFVVETKHVTTFDLSKFNDSISHWDEIEQSIYSTGWLKNLRSGIMSITHTSPFGGHVICEMSWAVIALTLGLGNQTTTKSQECSSASNIAESSATQIATGNTESPGITRFTSVPFTADINNTSATSTISPEVFSTAKAVTINGTQSNTNDSSLHCFCCPASSYSNSSRPSSEKMQDIINELKSTLEVPKKKTSAYIRKLTSAWDERKSSAGIGVFGVVILCVVFGSVIAMDLATLFQKRKSVKVLI
ncbi:uncharacterized protein LOC132558395 [Ylistrum balloti]|uniref:uncharacterized protein LOC132558395 n=1 Tax=Ylistrum balloti TaxID=509963 RepID=UPI002905A82D|nr:uncharacterized protein LOC132558395 [Ylistrum balloti]